MRPRHQQREGRCADRNASNCHSGFRILHAQTSCHAGPYGDFAAEISPDGSRAPKEGPPKGGLSGAPISVWSLLQYTTHQLAIFCCESAAVRVEPSGIPRTPGVRGCRTCRSKPNHEQTRFTNFRTVHPKVTPTDDHIVP